jgi:hypothetical protein
MMPWQFVYSNRADFCQSPNYLVTMSLRDTGDLGYFGLRRVALPIYGQRYNGLIHFTDLGHWSIPKTVMESVSNYPTFPT